MQTTSEFTTVRQGIMTLDFYNLKEEPFGFLPDSRFLYLSSTHRQALGSLLLALQGGSGFVTLLAQRGLGKTTLLFHTLNSFSDRVGTVYLFQAPRTRVDLLRAVLADLEVHTIDEHEAGMLAQLRQVLIAAHRLGRRVIIVIDEAQNLDSSVFDLLCSLSNLETLGAKLIQFILCGQPILTHKLAAIQSTQLMERGAAASLEPFSVQDTIQYVDHRLRTAGYNRQSPLFTPEAAALVARYSQGSPRVINHLCFEALSAAYRDRRAQIGIDTVHEAAAALDMAQLKPITITPPPLSASAVPQVTAARIVRPLPAPAQPGEDRVLPAWPAPREKPAAAKSVATPRHLPSQETKRAGAKPLAFPAARTQTNTVPQQKPRSQNIPRPLRSSASRLPGMAIAAVLLVVVTGAVVAANQTQPAQPPTRHVAAAPIAPPTQAPPLIAMEPATVSAAPVQQASRTEPAPAAPARNLKAMDLKSALRALSTRKQRQKQDLQQAARAR